MSLKEGMFSFANDKYVDVMLKMAKERLGADEVNDILQTYASLDRERFVKLCRQHQFEGMAASFLKKYGGDAFDAEWVSIYEVCHRKASEKLEAAKEISARMAENGIDMIVLKNGGILADIIDDPAKMPMGDIDTVVRRKDFLKAYEVMLGDGYKFEYSNEYEVPDINNAYRDGDAEYFKQIAPDHLLCCEIAWRIVAGRWMRPDCEPDTEANFLRMHYAKDTKVGILSPEDNLLQVCIHTAKHSFVRAPGLRLNLDVERIVSHTEINWNLFYEKVKAAHTKTAVYYSLYIPHILFDTPIPDFVLEELRPKQSKCRKIEKMLGNAGFLYPDKRKFSRIGFLRFQTALYDSASDMFRTLYPSAVWLKQRYAFHSSLLIPYYICVRALDLLGIRKRQK